VNDIAPDGMTKANGYCIVSDMADNKAFLVWKCQGKMGDKCNGDFQWTGGTGEYAGIKGNNRFFGMTLVPSNSGYSEWDGGWELP